MNTIDLPNAVVVYGASSPDVAPVYKEAAAAIGHRLASLGVTLVSGGGRSGLMAAAIDGALEAGGHAVGVLPQFMVDRGWGHPGLSETVVTPDMHARKRTMASMVRGAIALPGGCGTLEELLEIITWRQLGLYHGNVVIADINGFYTPLLQMLHRTVDEHMMHPDHLSLWSVATDAAMAVEMSLRPCTVREFTQKIR